MINPQITNLIGKYKEFFVGIILIRKTKNINIEKEFNNLAASKIKFLNILLPGSNSIGSLSNIIMLVNKTTNCKDILICELSDVTSFRK